MTEKTDSKEREALRSIGEEQAFEAWFKVDCPVEGANAKIAAKAAWKARASLAASAVTDCARCGGSGEDPEGFYDQSRGDAGHTHDGPCRTCNGSGVAASAGSEPVAWRAQFDAWWARNRVSTHQVKNIGGFAAKVWHAAIQTVVGATDSTAGFYPADEGSTTSRQATHPSPPEGMVGGWMPIETAPVAGLILLVVEDGAGERRVFPAEASHENGVWMWQVTL